MKLGISSDYEKEENFWLVRLSGELDVSSAEGLKNELNGKIDQIFTDIKIDMSNLDYIDSTGIGIIVGIMKRLRGEKKDISILNARENIKKIFNITGLDQIISMEG